jgi:predicted Ser/Thr protein kinase
MIGRRLRQYLITASLGRGGMGEVWLARDTTLERDAAIKTLPAAGDADDAIRKERFFREARAASALNHPNIITIYEINADEGVDFIAMEYVDGRTLADLLQHGPLPFDSVHRLAHQIAEAVGRAHRAGIVHRDLKPRNIMVTNDGLVKVLDFGLAKITHAGVADDAATQAALTRSGTTVGTLGYMSPEQAVGDAVDARSDVFSFGVILYEMLTGQLPFSGKTMSDVLRQLHFSEPPSVESLRAAVPPSLRSVVTKALQKLPDDRFGSMSEVAGVLSSARSDAMTTVVATPAPAVSRSGRSIPRIAAAGLVIVLIAGLAVVSVRRSRTRDAAPPAAANAPSEAATAAAAPVPTAISAPPSIAAPRVPAPAPALEPSAPPQRDVRIDRPAMVRATPQIAAKTGDPDAESQRALDLARRGDRKAAFAAIEPFAARQDLSAQALFNMAIVYELAGARPRALMSLTRAVRAGYPVRDVLATPELAALRKDPRFQRMGNTGPARKRPAPQ